ncbi:MAG: putative glycosyl transferase [Solidesulfovibrio magneticus str. Maddingley MBC34]|uniref:Putative glycosyl transferase n=1 Tax=Solidesulfovibrio magneticus str. Maddingley MBC34 TaxID=1206767 RepID=K6HDL2_9BACT|nr:MAG: putative glycosyl transferase [Solidesulfovibrio magneticus str. Maddingley MBC34]
MRIAVYCQHVLGMGHLFRTLEIVAALDGYERLLAVGGPDVPAAVPPGVRLLRLPPLAMDADFRALTLEGPALEAAKAARLALLLEALADFTPDVFFVELYPFGRKAFEFELLPAIRAVRERGGKVVCGVRDILVEKKDQAAYETRVLDRLHRCFDAVCVHGDPTLFPLSATFSRAGDIALPVAHTGYVAPARATPEAAAAARAALGVAEGKSLVVVSAGGGKVGSELPAAVLAACRDHGQLAQAALRVFSGPFCDEDAFAAMVEAASQLPDARVARFTPDFPAVLAGSDLSVSLAGYNTVMALLAARCRALVMPFDQNREQRLRAKRLAALGLLGVLEPSQLAPHLLAPRLAAALTALPPPPGRIDLDGAAKAAKFLVEIR